MADNSTDATLADRRENPKLLEYFKSSEWALFWLIATAGILLRWIDLDQKPYHHDESQHAMFGKYFYDFPELQYYKYIPMLHGPLLYNFMRLVYLCFGDSFVTARIPVALLGTLFIFTPLVFRRFMHPRTLLFLAAAIALSPTLIYWSRFIIHDFFVLAAQILTLYGVVQAKPKHKPLYILLGFTLQYCIKANVFVTLAIVLGYLFYEGIYLWYLNRRGYDSFKAMGRLVRDNPWATAIAAAVSLVVFCYFYTSGFRYRAGMLDGLYRASIPYWLEHHSIERIRGPFLHHFYVFCWYELAFVPLFLWHLMIFYRSAGRIAQRVAMLTVLVAAISAISYLGSTEQDLEKVQIWKFFKLKDPRDIFGLFLILIHPVIVTTVHLHRSERLLAFWGYLFTASFFSYSYLGEKVPWLSIYPLAAGFIYLALFFEKHFRVHPWRDVTNFEFARLCRFVGKILLVFGLVFVLETIINLQVIFSTKVLGEFLKIFSAQGLRWLFLALRDAVWENFFYLGVGLALYLLWYVDRWIKYCGRCNALVLLTGFLAVISLRAAILTNFVYSGAETEYISQVHTTQEFHNIALRLRYEATTRLRAEPVKILGEGDSVWPITWYMVGVPDFKFSTSAEERKTFDYILQTYDDNPTNIPEGFEKRKITLRGWWVPDFGQMTFKKFCNYAVNHIAWSPSGYTYLWFVNKVNKP